MRIFIIGRDEAGKSLSAWLLANELKCHYIETGRGVIERLAELYAANIDGRKRTKKCWMDILTKCKHEFRRELRVMGDLITRIKPTSLADNMGMNAKIVVGLRRQIEAEEFMQRHGWDESRWIRVEREDSVKNGFELDHWPVHFTVSNNGKPKELQEKLRKIAQQLRHAV